MARRFRLTPEAFCEQVVGEVSNRVTLELVSKVNDIPKGSRLAVSTTLLAALVSVCMRATGQAQLAADDALPQLDLEAERRNVDAVLEAFDRGLVQACHDLGDGGIAVALVEMAWARSGLASLGVRCTLPRESEPLAARLFESTTE